MATGVCANPQAQRKMHANKKIGFISGFITLVYLHNSEKDMRIDPILLGIDNKSAKCKCIKDSKNVNRM